MEITIGKYIHRSVDDEVLTVMKKDKEIYRMNIREVEIISIILIQLFPEWLVYILLRLE